MQSYLEVVHNQPKSRQTTCRVLDKRVTMGAFDFVYDVRKQTLTSEVKNSRGNIIFELAVGGDTLEGTLSTLPDKAIVRRIKVKKNERTDGAT